jgi:hypothetical protein
MIMWIPVILSVSEAATQRTKSARPGFQSLINCVANVRTNQPEMFRFAQHDRRTAVRFFK